MAIAESIGRIGATLVALVQTRLELVAVEMEEESLRLMSYLMLSLLALFLFGIAVVMVALFVVILFWDTYRLQAVLGMAVLFAGAGAWLALKVRAAMASKPRMLAHTIAELQKDIEFVKTVSQPHEPE
jgi:uncharacterized membrane protein YqjE